MSYWTDEKNDQLTALHKQGLSGGQIARIMGGITRNAVIGRAFRMGLGQIGGGKASAPAKAPKAERFRSPAAQPSDHAWRPRTKLPMPQGVMVLSPLIGGDVATAARVENMEARANPPETVLALARAFVPLPGRTPAPFGSKGCRWPVGGEGADLAQCGEPRDERRGEGCPYCSTHASVAFKAAPAKTRTGSQLARSLRRFAA